MARHAGGASGTLRLATRRRVLAIQPFELGGLLIIQHAPEIVVVFHALVPADRLSCRARRRRRSSATSRKSNEAERNESAPE